MKELQSGFFVSGTIVAALGIGVLLFLPIFVPGFLSTYQTAWSTFFSAVVGFSGLIFVTNLGFKNARQSANEQAHKNRQELERQWNAEREGELRRREDEARSLATALTAELQVVKDVLKYFVETRAPSIIKTYDVDDEKNSKIQDHISDYIVTWGAPFPVYHANLDRLGLLPLEVASQVVKIVGKLHRNTQRKKCLGKHVPEMTEREREDAQENMPELEVVLAALENFVRYEDNEPRLPFAQ